MYALLTFYSSEGAQNLTADACDGDGAIVILDEIQNKVYLESPNFPSNYQDDEYYQWIIKSACHDVSQIWSVFLLSVFSVNREKRHHINDGIFSWNAYFLYLKGSYRNLSISALEFYTAETNDHVFIRRDRGPVSVVIDTLYGKKSLIYN